MTTASAPTTYTPEEVARLSDQADKLYELVDGELVEKRKVSKTANWIAGQVSFLLRGVYPPDRAYIFPEQPTYCFGDSRRMRRPDVALVWAERLSAGLDDDDLFIPPDLVVEVVSPTNTFDDQAARVDEYLTAGVPIAWLVHPGRRFLYVYRRERPGSILRAADMFKDESLLPGLTLAVADLFPPVATSPTLPATAPKQ